MAKIKFSDVTACLLQRRLQSTALGQKLLDCLERASGFRFLNQMQILNFQLDLSLAFSAF